MLLAGISLGLLLSQYIRTLHTRAAADFTERASRALQAAYIAILDPYEHTTNPQNRNSFRSELYDADSSFVLVTNETVQNYPLMEWEGDTLLAEKREKQFQAFARELAATQSSMPHLTEYYMIRLIQYCDTCLNGGRMDTARIARYDSVLQAALGEQEIETDFAYGLYRENQDWLYLSQPAHAVALQQSPFAVSLNPGLQLFLYFPRQQWAIFQAILQPLLAPLAGLLLLMACFLFMHVMIRQQQRLSEHKTDFINNMTHELKTPIATIDFALANIENPQIIQYPDKIKQITQVIREENKRMHGQVEQVLRAARTEQGKMELRWETVNVHQLINTLADSLEIQIASRKGTLRRTMNAANAVVKGDAFHLSHALSNLLDNAVKYSPQSPEICISTESNLQGITVSVRDRGLGIKKEDQKKIFDRFYRVPVGNLHNIKGFGLGLHYAKAVALAHEGTLTVESKPGQGSEFQLFLPFHPPY